MATHCMLIFYVSVQHSFFIRNLKVTPENNKSKVLRTRFFVCHWHRLHFLSWSLFSSLLAVLQIEGINVKSLRAFRVLRPLRLLSSIPSKSRKFKLLQKIIIDGNSWKFRVILTISTTEENMYIKNINQRSKVFS